MSIMILTEPDTPLNNADHVGSFNFIRDVPAYGIKAASAVYDN